MSCWTWWADAWKRKSTLRLARLPQSWQGPSRSMSSTTPSAGKLTLSLHCSFTLSLFHKVTLSHIHTYTHSQIHSFTNSHIHKFTHSQIHTFTDGAQPSCQCHCHCNCGFNCHGLKQSLSLLSPFYLATNWKQWSERKLRFADDGANFSINSDDPMVTGTWTQQVVIRFMRVQGLWVHKWKRSHKMHWWCREELMNNGISVKLM